VQGAVNITVCRAAAAMCSSLACFACKNPDVPLEHQSPDSLVERVLLLEGVDVCSRYFPWFSVHRDTSVWCGLVVCSVTPT